MGCALGGCESPSPTDQTPAPEEVEVIYQLKRPSEKDAAARVINHLEDTVAFIKPVVDTSAQGAMRAQCQDLGVELREWIAFIRPDLEYAATLKLQAHQRQAIDEAYKTFEAQAMRCLVGGEVFRESLRTIHALVKPLRP